MELLAEWRPVVDWSGLYEVSDTGDVRSVPRVVELRDGRRRRVPGGPMTVRVYGGNPYPQVRLSRPGERVMREVHVIVCEAFHGPRPTPDHEARHLDGVHDHVAATNLAWGTSAENTADARRHGRCALEATAQRRRDQRECLRGHPLEGVNVMPSAVKRGHRSCLACNRACSRLGPGAPEPVVQALADTLYADLIAA